MTKSKKQAAAKTQAADNDAGFDLLDILQSIEKQQEAHLQKMLPKFAREIREIHKLDMLYMKLPDGTYFGDALLIDLMPYAEMTMNEIAELLVDDESTEEVELIEDGERPAPSEAEFISEDEDANPSGVVR